MSLHRQLLLAIVVCIGLAFVGSFAATMLAARGYLEAQLAVKNADNAAALALSMSQLDKDRATLDLQVVSLFETGQYASIRVTDAKGAVVAQRAARTGEAGAPAWFVGLLPIASTPGVGQIGDGYRQFGRVEVTSVAAFAYRDLYRGALQMLTVFAVAALAIAVLGAAILARIRRPLAQIVEQARAIAERRYLTVPPPSVPELRSVGEAMNRMVERVRAMFAEEAARLEAMRMAANLDELTRLPNRGYFMNRLRAALDIHSGAGSGAMALFRLRDLAGINRDAGREAADALIRGAADAAAERAESSPQGVAGRLNGADFAVLLPGAGDPREAAAALLAALDALPPPGTAERPLGAGEWRERLLRALAAGRLKLETFETRAFDGTLAHRECFVRLRLDDDGEWLPAGRFLPQVARAGLTVDFDLAVAREMAGFGGGALALNLSADSLGDANFGARLAAVVAAAPGLAGRLWLDVPEKGIFQHPEGFRDLARRMKALGCRVGADHFGHRFDRIGGLHGSGLDYVKIDASFIDGLAASPGNRGFLKGACGICRNMGFAVYAIGVASTEDLAALADLGFDGATGPAVRG